MKRFLTLAILFHWMMFFGLHAFGAFAGDLSAMNDLPLVGAGLSFAALLASVLFAWAFLAASARVDTEECLDTDIERSAFSAAALVLSILSMVAIAKALPDMLTSSTVYLAALLVSWVVASAEWELLSARALDHKESAAVRHARRLAGEAAWQTRLERISGRGSEH